MLAVYLHIHFLLLLLPLGVRLSVQLIALRLAHFDVRKEVGVRSEESRLGLPYKNFCKKSPSSSHVPDASLMSGLMGSMDDFLVALYIYESEAELCFRYFVILIAA